MSERIIEITEDLPIPGTEFVLEEGDRIKVLTEAIEVDEVPFYSYYGSALINGDYSGLSSSEEKTVESFINWVKQEYGNQAQVVDMSDETNFTSLPPYMPSDLNMGAGDMADYTIHYQE